MPLLADLLKMLDLVAARPAAWALGAMAARRPGSPEALGPPGRVLVIRPGGIGDAVLFLPLLQQLRTVWPAARVDLLAERRNSGVVAATGLVDVVYRYDAAGDLARVLRNSYDVVIDTEQYHAMPAIVAYLTRAPRRVGFATNSRRRLLTHPVRYDQATYEAHAFLALGEAATGRPAAWDPTRPFYPVDDASRAFAAAALAPLGDRPIVVVHPGASIPERRWPVDRYEHVAAQLARDGAGIVVIGSAADRAAAELITRGLPSEAAVNLAGRTTLPQAAAVIQRAKVYLSSDTGPLHLAFAVGTPTVHLFGPGVLSKWGPPGPGFTSIAADVPCSPCTTYGYTPPCCQGAQCMTRIGVNEVYDALRARLALRRRVLG